MRSIVFCGNAVTRLGRIARVAAVAALPCVSLAATANEASPGVSFVNGGITQDEADSIRARATDYPLEIVFATRTDTGSAFAADVHVRITDESGRTVMLLPDADPILLANLPPGRYTVEATYEGETRRQRVDLGRGHAKLGFEWGGATHTRAR